MDPVHAIQIEIKRRLPNAQTSVDPPAKPGGVWFLDVTLGGRGAIVQWNPSLKKFGVSSLSDALFTHKPDEIFDDEMSAAGRVVELLKP